DLPQPPVTGEVRVLKKDANTGAVLAGAVFELWTETNGIPGLQTSGPNPDTHSGAPCTTGADGVCRLTHQSAGNYSRRASAAPAAQHPALHHVGAPDQAAQDAS
ncbi:SpaA isopeptide-forming pilin-related protein, partial [Streptomyces sp. BE303]|uniref:SpaA isopeptide-forming pilin-related protein n=1 Tax=Streptomyces sp. BE303 TaxID=3002528 RepID=UPI002E77FDDB